MPRVCVVLTGSSLKSYYNVKYAFSQNTPPYCLSTDGTRVRVFLLNSCGVNSSENNGKITRCALSNNLKAAQGNASSYILQQIAFPGSTAVMHKRSHAQDGIGVDFSQSLIYRKCDPQATPPT
jgi:hypothetical protein